MGILDDLIDQALDGGEPDPHLIANWVLRHLPEDQVRPALERCLVYEVRQHIRRQRSPHVRAPRGSSKWQAAIADVLRERYWTGKGWMFLGDCTLGEIEDIYADYLRRAAQNQAAADRFIELHDEMQAAGVNVVSDLGAERVAEIIHVEFAKV